MLTCDANFDWGLLSLTSPLYRGEDSATCPVQCDLRRHECAYHLIPLMAVAKYMSVTDEQTDGPHWAACVVFTDVGSRCQLSETAVGATHCPLPECSRLLFIFLLTPCFFFLLLFLPSPIFFLFMFPPLISMAKFLELFWPGNGLYGLP